MKKSNKTSNLLSIKKKPNNCLKNAKKSMKTLVIDEKILNTNTLKIINCYTDTSKNKNTFQIKNFTSNSKIKNKQTLPNQEKSHLSKKILKYRKKNDTNINVNKNDILIKNENIKQKSQEHHIKSAKYLKKNNNKYYNNMITITSAKSSQHLRKIKIKKKCDTYKKINELKLNINNDNKLFKIKKNYIQDKEKNNKIINKMNKIICELIAIIASEKYKNYLLEFLDETQIQFIDFNEKNKNNKENSIENSFRKILKMITDLNSELSPHETSENVTNLKSCKILINSYNFLKSKKNDVEYLMAINKKKNNFESNNENSSTYDYISNDLNNFYEHLCSDSCEINNNNFLNKNIQNFNNFDKNLIINSNKRINSYIKMINLILFDIQKLISPSQSNINISNSNDVFFNKFPFSEREYIHNNPMNDIKNKYTSNFNSKISNSIKKRKKSLKTLFKPKSLMRLNPFLQKKKKNLPNKSDINMVSTIITDQIDSNIQKKIDNFVKNSNKFKTNIQTGKIKSKYFKDNDKKNCRSYNCIASKNEKRLININCEEEGCISNQPVKKYDFLVNKKENGHIITNSILNNDLFFKEYNNKYDKKNGRNEKKFIELNEKDKISSENKNNKTKLARKNLVNK